MKLAVQNDTLETNLEQNRINKYKFDESSIRDFSLLVSSKIYTRKIDAVIREVSCNAADAASKSDRRYKFDITVPSINQNGGSYFECRDYGPGLSEDSITNIYTNIMKSTKRNDDTVIGCFGVGSKSPFTYSEVFFVTSYFNNTATIYQMIRTLEGFNYVKVSSIPSKEPSGLSVKVPVLNKDVKEFRDSIINYFCTWATNELPFFNDEDKKITDEINNQSSLKSVDELSQFKIDDTTIKLYTITHLNYLNKYIKMGHVMYRLDDSILNSFLQKDESIKDGIVIEVPNGFVAPSISRETLEYTKYTLDNIQAIICKLREIYNDKFKEIVDKNMPVFQTYEAYSNLMKTCNLLKFLPNQFQYKGIDILYSKPIQYNYTINFEKWPKYKPNSSIYSFKDYWHTNLRNKNNIEFKDAHDEYDSLLQPYYFKRADYNMFNGSKNITLKNCSTIDVNIFSLNQAPILLINDIDTQLSASKITLFIKWVALVKFSYNVSQIFVIDPNLHKELLKTYEFYVGKNNRTKSLVDLYTKFKTEFDNHIKVIKPSYKFTGVEAFDISNYYCTNILLKNANKGKEVDMSEGGVYVNTSVKNTNNYQNHITTICKYHKFLGLPLKTIYGFKQKILNSDAFAENRKKWSDYNDLKIDFLEKIETSIGILNFLNINYSITRLEKYNGILHILFKIEKYYKQSPLVNIFKASNDLYENVFLPLLYTSPQSKETMKMYYNLDQINIVNLTKEYTTFFNEYIKNDNILKQFFETHNNIKPIDPIFNYKYDVSTSCHLMTQILELIKILSYRNINELLFLTYKIDPIFHTRQFKDFIEEYIKYSDILKPNKIIANV
jgi:hypothetical protein